MCLQPLPCRCSCSLPPALFGQLRHCSPTLAFQKLSSGAGPMEESFRLCSPGPDAKAKVMGEAVQRLVLPVHPDRLKPLIWTPQRTSEHRGHLVSAGFLG